jgi:hypothetical protein
METFQGAHDPTSLVRGVCGLAADGPLEDIEEPACLDVDY